MRQQSEQTSAPQQRGRVVSYFGSSVAVEAADGQVFQCHLRRNHELPLVGDWVKWQVGHTADSAMVTEIEPRRSVLARGDDHGNMKLLAANIDIMAIVMAPPPVLTELLVNRYLAAAEILNIAPVIVLNKSDLMSEKEANALDLRLQQYRKVPYPVILTSAVQKTGLDELIACLSGKNAVLVGPSGVGKSSLINALTQETIRVQEVSPKGTGKHTTTATRFYHLPQGGGVIDSPGVRDFSLWPLSEEEVLSVFKEFKPFMTGCKFRNCKHNVEPGCSVQEAVANGKIGAERFESYRLLLKDAVHRKKIK